MMGKKLTGLRVLLTHSHFLAVTLPEDVAREFVRKWTEGEYNGALFVKGVSYPDGHPWTARLDAVVAMHTFALDTAPPPQVRGQAGSPWGRSGN